MLKINNLTFIEDKYDNDYNVFLDVELCNCNYTFMTTTVYIPDDLYSFIMREIHKYEKQQER